MQLQSEMITVRGQTLEVREMTIGEFSPLIAQKIGSDQEFQLEMLKRCVFKDGVVLGEEVVNLPSIWFRPLALAMNRLNKLVEEEGQEGGGND